jgi:hypothetical protein
MPASSRKFGGEAVGDVSPYHPGVRIGRMKQLVADFPDFIWSQESRDNLIIEWRHLSSFGFDVLPRHGQDRGAQKV